MGQTDTIYILGAGAIGFPLAAFLANAGRRVVAVRTSRDNIAHGTRNVTVQSNDTVLRVPVATVSLAGLTRLDGTIVLATKAHANNELAQALKDKHATGPLVILQNGLGVERPFLEAPFSQIYRCVLYVTSQATADNTFTFRPVTASPIGIVRGDEAQLTQCIADLTTEGFPFRAEAHIQREVWKKAIINAVFNSICPLLDIDNGIFARDAAAADLAREIISECVLLTDRLDLRLSERELMDQLLLISQRSSGQLISTLQDLRNNKPTEIAFLNLEIARVAAHQQPPLDLPKVALLGKLIVAKSVQQHTQEHTRTP
jgi:2-dehydropantoate 2-reductase